MTRHHKFSLRTAQTVVIAGLLGLGAGCALPGANPAATVASQQAAQTAPQGAAAAKLAAMGADLSTAQAPYLGAQFKAVNVNGHLYCTDCGTELNAAGRHKVSNLMIKDLNDLSQPGFTQGKSVQKGQVTYADVLALGAARLGLLDAVHATPDNNPYAQVLAQLATANGTPTRSLMASSGYPTGGSVDGLPQCPAVSTYGCPGTYSYTNAVDWIMGNTNFRCCVSDGVPVTDPPYCYADAFTGQSDAMAGSASDLQDADALPALYHCFPDCNEVGPSGDKSCQLAGANICNAPPVNFAGQVSESSSPDFGSGHNGALSGVAVTLTGSMDSPINRTTDASGNYSGTYQPPSAPTAMAKDFGMTVTGGANGPLVFYTDANAIVMEDPGSAPDAEGVSFALTAGVNDPALCSGPTPVVAKPAAGGGGSGGASAGSGGLEIFKGFFIPLAKTSFGAHILSVDTQTKSGYTLSRKTPKFLAIPRNPGCADSNITISSVDNPRFTWFGDGGLSLSSSAAPGTTANNIMAVKLMHKWVDVTVTLNLPAGASGSDVTLGAYDAASATPGTYPDAALFGLPTVVDAGGSSLAQSNPTKPGVLHIFVETTSRLATSGAPYKTSFYLHAAGGDVISLAKDELVTIDDAARISGKVNKTLTMVSRIAK